MPDARHKRNLYSLALLSEKSAPRSRPHCARYMFSCPSHDHPDNDRVRNQINGLLRHYFDIAVVQVYSVLERIDAFGSVNQDRLVVPCLLVPSKSRPACTAIQGSEPREGSAAARLQTVEERKFSLSWRDIDAGRSTLRSDERGMKFYSGFNGRQPSPTIVK